jgi:hypothetical protein
MWVRFENDTTNREFDAVSEDSIAQSKPAGFQLGSNFRSQAKATFDAAVQNGKTPHFHFEGLPHPDVLSKVAEYAARYGIGPAIGTNPLF